jgi:integrase/recombinase XerD
MGSELARIEPVGFPAISQGQDLPALVIQAGPAAAFVWEEYFQARHTNRHTQRAYGLAVRRFLAWAEGQGVTLPQITPGMVGGYISGLETPSRQCLALSALRGFFDGLVNRHVVILNPAASVKGFKEKVVEGKTPEISVEQARTLLASLDTGTVIGLRDRAIIATLAYTACRAGAVARLRLGDFQCNGTQFVLRFREKGNKSREIPVRHDLEGYIRAYLDAAGLGQGGKDTPLYRASNGRHGGLSERPLDTTAVGELVKRRLKAAGLPERLSPHSFRVMAITSLLTQGVPLEDVQYLAGHSEAKTTGLYDRRQKRVTRNIVERIPV